MARWNGLRDYKDGNLFIRDAKTGQSRSDNMWADCPILASLNDPTLLTRFEDDFIDYLTTLGTWTTTMDATGSVAITTPTSGHQGVVLLTTHTGDEDETYINTTAASFILGTGKRLWFEALVKLTEANTDDGEIYVGLNSDITVARLIQDADAGPYTDYDGIGFFKVGAGLVWGFENSLATAQTTTASVGAFVSGAWTKLGIKVDSGVITGYINNVAVVAHSTNLPTAAMKIAIGVKASSANAEALYVDYVKLAMEK
jgi:hypothetical protein